MKVVITGANGQLGKAFRDVYPEAVFIDIDEIDYTASYDEIKNKVLGLKPDVFILFTSVRYPAL